MDESNVNATNRVLNINGTEELLEATYHHYILTYMPIIVFMSLTTFMGLVGNVFTILFFGLKVRKTSTIVFIVAVAALDLTVCCMACIAIAHMCVNVYLSEQYLCKVEYFFDHWTVGSSVLVLWIISIDRYCKICKPFGRQLTVKSAFIAVFVLIGISLVLATQSFVTFGIVQVDITAPDGKSRVIVNYCTMLDKPEFSAAMAVLNIVRATIMFSVVVTFVVTYSQLWYVLRKTRTRQSMGSQTRVANEDSSSKIKSTSLSNLNKSASAESLRPKINTRITLRNDGLSFHDTASQSSDRSLEVHPFPVVRTKKAESKQVADKTGRAERNITIMMFVVSVGFAVCFTPYFIVSAIRMATSTGEHEMAAWVQFLLRCPFFNSVINPVIFCLFNPQFRRYVRSVTIGCKVN